MSISSNVLAFPPKGGTPVSERVSANDLLDDLEKVVNNLPIPVTDRVLLMARIKAVAMRSFLQGANMLPTGRV